jgi:hypothetical protein
VNGGMKMFDDSILVDIGSIEGGNVVKQESCGAMLMTKFDFAPRTDVIIEVI